MIISSGVKKHKTCKSWIESYTLSVAVKVNASDEKKEVETQIKTVSNQSAAWLRCRATKWKAFRLGVRSAFFIMENEKYFTRKKTTQFI